MSKDSSAWLGRLADEGWAGAAGTRARKLLGQYLATYRTKQRARCVPCTGWHDGVFVLPDTVLGQMSDGLGGFIRGSENSCSCRPDSPPHSGFFCPPYQNVSDVSDVVGHTSDFNKLHTSDKENSCRTLSDVFPSSAGEKIVLQVRTAHNPFRVDGTLEGWRDSVGAWAAGNSRLMLALCASLAAPLLEVSGMESGGFNWTGQSSTGKTTALVAAGSVWGKGSSSGGYVQNWRATANGLEGLAALHSDAALCLDEIGQAPARTVQEAAYMLANGMGKSRAYTDGTAKAVATWRCMVLSTGEKGLAEKIVEEGGKIQAGQLVRLIDIPADAGADMGIFENIHGFPSPQQFAEEIKLAASTHYGHAARAFIGRVQAERQQFSEELHTFLTEGLGQFCPADSSGQVKRVARRFLLCAAAGETASEWGIIPWGKGEALQAAKTCFDIWLDQRGGVGAAEDTAILEAVMLFLEQHGASRFQDVDNPSALCINRVGFRRSVPGGTEFLILPQSFRTNVCKGHDSKRAALVLLANGLLVPGDGRNLMRQSPIALPEYGRKRCYTILIKDGWQNVDN